MVRRLVKEEKICGQEAKDCKFEAAALATGEHCHLPCHLITAKEEPCKVRACLSLLYWNHGTERLEDCRAMKAGRTDLRKIARDHSSADIETATERRDNPRHTLQECGLSGAIHSDNTDSLSSTEEEASCFGDRHTLGLTVADDRMTHPHHLSWAAAGTRCCNVHRCRATLRYWWLDCSKAALMLMHLCVFSMTPIRLDQLFLACNCLCPLRCVTLPTFVYGFALARIVAVPAAEAGDPMVAHLPDALNDRIEEGSIVACDEECPLASAKGTFEPFDCTDIKVVRWFVEHEKVRVRDDEPRERQACLLPT
jgi:hypothetical protein